MSTPYITVNKLAEYMQATSTRRRQIIKSLKEDKDFRKLYYAEVKNTLPGFFRSRYDHGRIDAAIKRIERKKGTTSWDGTDNPNSILALESLKNSTLPDLSNYEFVTDIEKLQNLNLQGVNISIKPEIYLRHKVSEKIGAIKAHIAKTKTNQLDSIGLQYAATIIKCGFMSLGYSESEIENRGCISIDIFQKSFDTAPRAYKRNLGALEASCEEIAARWVTI